MNRTLEEIKLSQGFHSDEPCIDIIPGANEGTHYWVCGNMIGPVTNQIPLEELLLIYKEEPEKISFFEVVDELTGELVLILTANLSAVVSL